MKLFKNTGLILGSPLLLMIATTPNQSEYIDHLQTEMSKKAEENKCNTNGIRYWITFS